MNPHLASLPHIVLTMGDPAGVGPEVVVRALADPSLAGLARWSVSGDEPTLRRAASLCGVSYPEVPVLDPHLLDQPPAFGRLDPRCGAAAVEYVRRATLLCLSGEAAALVTAPLNKEAVTLSGMPFTGHTEYIAQLCGATESRMLLAGEKISTIHVTTHMAMRQACDITEQRVFRTLELGHDAMRLLGFEKPRLAVCGLNAHAGEHGLFGLEDQQVIAPAIARARLQGIDASGPHPSDTIFLTALRGAYDLVVAIYHDQGHIAMKLIDFEGTVNISLGIPVIRTSVDHGTALDLAVDAERAKRADDGSLHAAVELAIELASAAAR